MASIDFLRDEAQYFTKDIAPDLFKNQKFKLKDLADDRNHNPRTNIIGFVKQLEQYGCAIVKTRPHYSSTVEDWAAAVESTDFKGNTNLVQNDMALCPITILTDLLGFRTFCGYGEYFFVHTKAAEDQNNPAYTSGALSLHTDLPDSRTPPEIQFLYYHKMDTSEASGGASTLCDGYRCAKQIEQEDPEAYKLLQDTKITYIDGYTEKVQPSKAAVTYRYRFKHPVIGVTSEQENGIASETSAGNFVHCGLITHSDAHRSPEWGGLAIGTSGNDDHLKHNTPEFQRAFRLWQSKLEENIVEFRMDETDILVFDNLRMLHGRTAISTRQERKLIGTYTRWDELKAVARAKAEQFRTTVKLFGET